MAHLLAENLSKRFNKTIEIQPITVKAKTRIPMILQGVIDVEMGSSTHSQEREEKVDFSLIFFISETTFLVSGSSGIKTMQDLNAKIIGAAGGTTNLAAVQELVKAGRLTPKDMVVMESHSEGMRALKRGRIDAYCSDRILLNMMRLKDEHPDQWVTLNFAISYEPYAYILPEGNSDFRDFVNNTIRWSIISREYYKIYEKWMGPKGINPYKIPPAFKEYLNIISYPMKEDWWKGEY
jgi:ABC-type amino acid transport substrate-binding protein